MSVYDPDTLRIAAAKILALLVVGTTTKVAMKCAGFTRINKEYIIYRKRIERLRDKLKSEHPTTILVKDGSIEAASILICSAKEVSKIAVCLLLSQSLPILLFYILL